MLRWGEGFANVAFILDWSCSRVRWGMLVAQLSADCMALSVQTGI